ncbi:DUF3172 domain-containing protein [Microcoleus sp. FACHB-1515]|uniref:DUF3172 domain-containing protein n=1 Tax=Cyanophyceae TaxID=3028117 RepID=UPI0016873C8C|nr:DUF3172 domain-containing protein [Microcoleus sp. FACHB-1515]
MRRKPPARTSSRDRDLDYREPPAPKTGLAATLNAGTMAILAAVLMIGIGIGMSLSTVASNTTGNIASREAIDRSAPNAELCVQYGASAITMDMRAFVTLNPFNVYVSQPSMQPGCVLRSNNWAILERPNLVTDQQVRECRQRMNTFGYTGDINDKSAAPKIDCIYQNDAARNLFPQLGNGELPETDRF